MAEQNQISGRLDRRNKERLNCSFSLDYQIDNRQGLFTAKVLNIGSEGLFFLVDTSLRKNEIINLFFPFFTGTTMIPVTVIRVEGREIAATYNLEGDKLDEFLDSFNKEYTMRHASSFLKDSL